MARGHANTLFEILQYGDIEIQPDTLSIWSLPRHAYPSVVPSSIVYSQTCNATAIANTSIRVSPHVWLHLITNATSHLPTHTCGLMLPTHAYPCHVPSEMHLSLLSTPSSASAQLVHISYTMCKWFWLYLPKAKYCRVLNVSVLNYNMRVCSELYRWLYRPTNQSISCSL